MSIVITIISYKLIAQFHLSNIYECRFVNRKDKLLQGYL